MNEALSKTLRLYHYCCSCSARLITSRGFLRPYGKDLFDVDLIWLTDQAIPDREGLGLTSHMLKCDRLQYQYIADVDPSQVEPWLTSAVRRALATEPGFEEFEQGRQPETWWIATSHIFVVRNRSYARMISPLVMKPCHPQPPTR